MKTEEFMKEWLKGVDPEAKIIDFPEEEKGTPMDKLAFRGEMSARIERNNAIRSSSLRAAAGHLPR